MITGQTTKNTYQGDGSNRVWNISFEFTDSSQIKFKVNGEAVTTNYELNPVAKTLTYPTVESELDPLTSADEIVIYRETSITQNIDFTNGGPLNAEMIEDGLDKLTMIAQELKAKESNAPSSGGLIVMPNGTDIDTLTEEGEYFVKLATCTSGFPSDLVTTVETANAPALAGVTAYVKVIPTVTESGYQTVKLTQLCYFYSVQSTPDNITGFVNAYIRQKRTAEGWSEYWSNDNISNVKRVISCGLSALDGNVFIPSKLYPNTTYKLGRVLTSYEVTGLTSLDLTDREIVSSGYPIEIYFKTGNSFSGITAPQIVAWIGSTTLDTDTIYKITITNLIAKIEEVTEAE